jgi:hypothetical protein
VAIFASVDSMGENHDAVHFLKPACGQVPYTQSISLFIGKSSAIINWLCASIAANLA